MRLLLVEDDPMIGESVRHGLRQDGFAVDWARDGKDAELALDTEPYDLLLLDLGLPGKSGLDLLKGLRRRGNGIPVLILTARDAVADRVRGLDAGADDYLVKPFDLEEMAARIRALLRRRAGRAQPLIVYGALTLDPVTHEAACRGNPLLLSAREFALLQALLEKPGAVLSRARLEERLYGWDEEVESNAVEVHIHNLRKKLGAEIIRTVRGVGYMVAKIP
ncbi:MAG: response regulator transcription factor [Deltaproteobacteria bacterium]|nr:response regulator transcription factor [Deltaproteobacteria bacterium]